MGFKLRLIEDILSAGATHDLTIASPRAIYVASGSVTINGRNLQTDDGIVTNEANWISAGAEGASLWRWEVAPGNDSGHPLDGRGHLKLAHPVDPKGISDQLLFRLDSVAFPSGGCALLHTHAGPGIRCLKEGTIRIDTEGTSTSYGPGGAWFEAGPEAVFAQADARIDSRFIRAMLLPGALLGASSISYVNEEDKDKPKSQKYRVFEEIAVDLTG